MQRLAFSCWMFLIGICCCSGSLFAQTSNALNFDNTDDEVLVPNASARIAGSSQLSLSFWVYRPTRRRPFRTTTASRGSATMSMPISTSSS